MNEFFEVTEAILAVGLEQEKRMHENGQFAIFGLPSLFFGCADSLVIFCDRIMP